MYNAEKRKAYGQTPRGRKSNIIGIWKFRGVVGDLDSIYDDIYLPAINCMCCKNPFSNRRDKCLDHDHSIVGSYNFRQVLCQRCNIHDNWKKYH